MANIKKLLSKGETNVKTAKNSLKTYILYLAPYKQNSKGINLCPNASQGCASACLYTAGRGKFSSVQKARINRANFYVNDREAFLAQLLKELSEINAKAFKSKEFVAIRLNGTSDIDFIGQIKARWNFDVLREFKNLVFYDYTKILGKIRKYKGQNYSLTFSRSENTSDFDMAEALNMGANVSVVFTKVPTNYKVYGENVNVIDGDASDIVMLYNKGKIIGLKAKGDAKKDKSNFVVQI